jgi:hypothetical protein
LPSIKLEVSTTIQLVLYSLPTASLPILPFLSTATYLHPARKAATPVLPSGQSLHSAFATADKAASYLHAKAHEDFDDHKPLTYFSALYCCEQADQI